MIVPKILEPVPKKIRSWILGHFVTKNAFFICWNPEKLAKLIKI